MNYRNPTVVGLMVISLWLVAEYILLGPASVVLTSSNGEIIIPALLGERFGGTNDLWQTLTSAGADKKIFSYYSTLDTFLFTTFPGWLAYGLRVSSVIAGAVIGAFWVSRQILNFSGPASLFVGAAYGVTIPGHFIASSIGFLPFVLFALWHVLENKQNWLKWLYLFAALYIFADTTYISQLIPWSLGGIIFWFLFADTRTSAKDWLVIIGSCLFLVILRVKTLIALIGYSPYSYLEYARTSANLSDLPTVAFSHIYFMSSPVSMACLVLFVFGFVCGFRKDKRARSIGLGLVIGIVLLPLAIFTQIMVVEIIPLLSGYRMGYVNRLPLLILPFAAGFGIEALGRGIQENTSVKFVRLIHIFGLVLAVGTVGFVSLTSKYANLFSWVTNGSYKHNFDSPTIEALAKKIRGKKMPIRVETFQIIPNYLHAYGLETASGYQAYHSKRYYEYWAKMVDPWASNIGPESRFYNQYSERRKKMKGDMAFRDDRLWLYPDSYQAKWRLGDIYNLNFLSLANVGYLILRERLVDTSLTPIREMPKPWSSLSAREKVYKNVRANIFGRQHLFIYKNETVFPRFFTVSRVKLFKKSATLLNSINAFPLNELRNQALVLKSEFPANQIDTESFNPRKIQVDHYGKDEIRLTLDGPGRSLLVVTNSYSPYWRVEIDGKPGQIFPAYHTFWGIIVPNNAKSITFKYNPPYKSILATN